MEMRCPEASHHLQICMSVYHDSKPRSLCLWRERDKIDCIANPFFEKIKSQLPKPRVLVQVPDICFTYGVQFCDITANTDLQSPNLLLL